MRMTIAPLFLGMALFSQDAGYIANQLPGHVTLQPRKLAATGKPGPKVILVQGGDVRCAHIIAYKPPDVDPKIVVGGGVRDKAQTRMPVIPGMGVCPEDVRELKPGSPAAQKDSTTPER